MIFCDKCGNLMIADKKGNKTVAVCRTCGHTTKCNDTAAINLVQKIADKDEKIPVVVEENPFKGYPKTKVICPECENNEAYWYLQQTRGADEPQTKFYSCTKCGHKWRDYA
jgi:DNA-directed RNA polymerase subunit M